MRNLLTYVKKYLFAGIIIVGPDSPGQVRKDVELFESKGKNYILKTF